MFPQSAVGVQIRAVAAKQRDCEGRGRGKETEIAVAVKERKGGLGSKALIVKGTKSNLTHLGIERISKLC